MNSWSGIPVDRVVAVVATLPSGLEQVGSGYLLAGGSILTAEHCTRDKKTGDPAVTLRAVRALDGLIADATVLAASRDDDVALLDVAAPPWPGELSAVSFGRVDRTRSGELQDCEAIGYPLWQLQPTDGQRNTAELHGTIRRTEDAESQFLLLRDAALDSVVVPRTANIADAERSSPWGGLSGALVFYEGVALGVVVQHQPRQGSSALRLVPFDRIASATSAETQAVAAALGLPSRERIEELALVPRNLPPKDADRRVVGFRPVGSLELWQDREAVRHDLKVLLMEGQRIISVVGRRGVGKSGVVTKVVADFEEPEAGDTAGIDGIVYMSTRTGSGEMTLAYIFQQIAELLPESEQARLSNRWASAGEATLDDLFDSLRARRVVVVLDNLDDLQEPETGEFRTRDVPTFLTAVATAPRAPQVVTTSQQRPLLPMDVRTGNRAGAPGWPGRRIRSNAPSRGGRDRTAQGARRRVASGPFRSSRRHPARIGAPGGIRA